MPKRTDTSLWHPFSDMAAVRGNEFVISRGEGVWLWDEDGNRYLDGSASLWYCNVGHGRAEIADAVAAQMKKLEAWSIFGDAATPPALELADALAELSSLDGAKIFFTTGGGDAIDTAAKLARLYWQVLGQPERLHIISRTSATTARWRSARRSAASRRTGPATGRSSRARRRCSGTRRRRCATRSSASAPERVGRVLHGAGDRRRRRAARRRRATSRRVAEICRDAGVLFVCDSVICGFGRLGTWLGFERFGVAARPRHVREGRHERLPAARRRRRLGAGRGAVLDASRAASWCATARPTPGHAAVCAAALANIDDPRARGPRHRAARELERELFDDARAARRPPARRRGARRHGHARRGRARPRRARATIRALPTKADKAIRPHGVILRALGQALAVSPPLTITSDEIRFLRDGVRAGLDALVESRVAA